MEKKTRKFFWYFEASIAFFFFANADGSVQKIVYDEATP